MTTTLTVPQVPKMVREALCVAEHAVNQNVADINKHGAPQVLAALINECDRHRPTGPDGKHGNRHTLTCGCEDVPGSALSIQELADAQPRQPGQRACSNVSCPLRYAHRGPCAPPGLPQRYGADLLLALADEAQHYARQGVEPLLNTTLAQLLRNRALTLTHSGQGRTFPFGMHS